MLIPEQISGPETLLKLYVAIDEDLKALRPQLQAKHLPRDPRGGTPVLSAVEVLTILVWGAWRGLKDKAKVYTWTPLVAKRSLCADEQDRIAAIHAACGGEYSRWS
jgi:hypothetical protein